MDVCKMRRTIFSLALLSLALVGCGGPSTKFTATWHNPEFQGRELKDVLVIGVSESVPNRNMFEAALTAELESVKIESFRAHQLMSNVEKLEREQVEALVKERGIDAVIVTRLLDVARDEHYVPPTTTVYSDYGYPGYGSPYYGHYYGYYSYGYSVVTSPGYSYTSVTVILETNLYDSATGEIIWSGQSESFDPESAADVIQPTARKIVDELVKEKLISP